MRRHGVSFCAELAHNRQYALPRPLSQLAHMCRYGRVRGHGHRHMREAWV